jgi:hypothetical protein
MAQEISSALGVGLKITFPLLSPFNFAFDFPSRPQSPIISLSIIYSYHYPREYVRTARQVLLTLTVIFVSSMASTAPSTDRHCCIHPVLIHIILVNYLIPIPSSDSQELACLVLPIVLWLNLCTGIITTISRETFGGSYDVPPAGYIWSRANNAIHECMRVVVDPIAHFFTCFANHLRHISADGCPSFLTIGTPAPALGPHQLELQNLASCDCSKKDYIINEVPCLLILDGENNVYSYESMDTF